jgi:hypothetical protein
MTWGVREVSELVLTINTLGDSSLGFLPFAQHSAVHVVRAEHSHLEPEESDLGGDCCSGTHAEYFASLIPIRILRQR